MVSNRDIYNKYNILNNNNSNTDAIINRLKEALGAGSDGQLATYLGISRQNIGAARKRDDVPTGWIYKVAELTGYSMDWLGFGQGPRKIRETYEEPRSEAPSQIANPQSTYQRLAVAESDRTTEDHGRESFGAAVEMLSRIYNSGDEALIRTIATNIRTFCEILDRK